MISARIGFSPWLIVAMFVCAAYHLYVYAAPHDLSNGPAGVHIAYASLFVVAAFLYAFGTYVRIENNQIQVKNAIGITRVKVRFASPHDLVLDGRTLWVLPVGKTERKRLSGFFADGTHWRALGDAIAQAKAAAPRPGATSSA